MKSQSLYFLFFILVACAPQKLAYFSVDPNVTTLVSKVNNPLIIKLSENIKDSLAVSGDQTKVMNVVEFRKSLATSLINTFSKNFSIVKVENMTEDTTIILEVKSVDPYLKIVDTIKSQRYIAGTSTHTASVYGAPGVNRYGGNSYLGGGNAVASPGRTTPGRYETYYQYLAKAFFKYEYELKNGGKIISSGTFIVSSNLKTQHSGRFSEVFIDGMDKMCQDLGDRVSGSVSK